MTEEEEFEFQLALEQEKAKKPKSGPPPGFQDAVQRRIASNPAEYDAASAEFQGKFGNSAGGFLKDYLKRELSPANVASAAVRPAVKAAASIPGVFADGTMAAFNLATGQNNQMPSAATNELLNKFTRQPEGVGKAAEFGSSVLLGSRIPMPQIGKQAPANFVAPKSIRDQTLADSQAAGYAVPPSTTNPSMFNRILESVGGKDGTVQDAALKNQSITNRLAKKALGIADDSEVDLAALNEIRAKAGAAYEQVKAVGVIETDDAYKAALDKVTEATRNAQRSFPGLGKANPVDDVVSSLKQDKFDSSDAIEATRYLREQADKAYAQGDKSVGKAFKSASQAVEDMIERALSQKGEPAKEILKGFRDARQTIAKTYSVEKALNQSTGNVSAQKLAQQLARGKPLTKDLKTAAKFGQAFPRAAREILDSGSVRNTDVIVGGGTAAVAQQPWYLVYPLLRQAARAGMLSPTGQKLAAPSTMQLPPGFFGGSAAAEQSLFND